MPTLTPDIIPETIKQFPKHGWALSSQGFRFLWFPILRLINYPHEFRKNRGADTDFLKIRDIRFSKAFESTLGKLAISLREIHFISREYAQSLSDESSAKAIRLMSLEKMPLFADLAFVYSRRLADRLAEACRPILFGKVGIAPIEYKALRRFVLSKDILKAEPLVDVPLLQQAFEQHSDWFDTLRGEVNNNGILMKGIRDAIEHRPVEFGLSAIQNGEDEWETSLVLSSAKRDVPNGLEIITTLKVVCADICNLLTGICQAAQQQGPYVNPHDLLLIIGDDADTTGFWPKISDDIL